jgi:hypothetical protein
LVDPKTMVDVQWSVENLTFAMEVVEEYTGIAPATGENSSVMVTFKGLGADVIAAIASGKVPEPSPSPGPAQSPGPDESTPTPDDAPPTPDLSSTPSARERRELRLERRELGMVVLRAPAAQARHAGRGLAEQASCEDLEITIDMADKSAADLSTAFDEAIDAINSVSDIIAAMADITTSNCAPEAAEIKLELKFDDDYLLDEKTVQVITEYQSNRIRLDARPDPPLPPSSPPPSPSPPPPSPPPGFPLPAALAAAIGNLESLLSDDGGNETDSGDVVGAAKDAAAALTDMFNNLGEGVPLNDALLDSVSSLADSLGSVAAADEGAAADGDEGAAETSEEDAESATNAMKDLLASVANAIAANSVPGGPPVTVKSLIFALRVVNAIVPDLGPCKEDNSCPEPELDEANPGAALGTGEVNLTKMTSRNASAAPALIVSTEMEGIAGAASAVMAVTNVPGNPGKGKVRPEEQPPAPPAPAFGPPPPPPPAFSSGAASTKLGVSVKDERRRKLREVRRKLGASNGPKCATAYVASANAKTDSSCRAAYLETAACAAKMNETLTNFTEQEDIKKEICAKVAGEDSWYAEPCKEAGALLGVLNAIHKNQTKLCQNISSPCSGPERGTCNVTADVCMCNPDWIGLQCENQPQAVIASPNGLSKNGATLAGLNPDTGAALIQGDGPADFSIMTETVEAPAMETAGEMTFNLPKPMTLEELIATLKDMKANEYIIIIGWFTFMIIVFKLCFAYDDSKAYVQFFPSWHEWLTGGRTNSNLWKIIGAQMVIVLCTDHIAMIFFILPTLPFQRSMRWMCLLVILHAKLAILALLYGPAPPPEAPPCVAPTAEIGLPMECTIFAQIIDICVGVFFQQLSLQAFMFSLIRNSDLSAVQAQVEKKAKRERQKTRWILAFRQTIPRSRARAAKAVANWSGDDILLLQNKNAPQYYDPHTLLRKVEELRHPTNGDFVFKMKLGKRGGVGGRGMDYTTSIWRQKSAINEDTIEGFKPIKVDRKHEAGLKGLRQGAAAVWDDNAKGMQLELPTDGPEPILTGAGSGDERDPTFQLGCPELNRFGGITAWDVSFSGTVHTVEIWLQNPHYKEGERSLLDKVRGKNKPINDGSQSKIKTKPKPKPKVSLAARGEQALGFVANILNKATETPEHQSRQKLKTSGNINRVTNVPACAFIRQPDGSVGFFVETSDDLRSAVRRSRVEPEEEAAAIREIKANKELQTKHVAKRLMTTMDAIDLKFNEAKDALTQSVGRGQVEDYLAELTAKRDNDMRELEAQVRRTRTHAFCSKRGHPNPSLSG